MIDRNLIKKYSAIKKASNSQLEVIWERLMMDMKDASESNDIEKYNETERLMKSWLRQQQNRLDDGRMKYANPSTDEEIEKKLIDLGARRVMKGEIS